MFCNMHINLRHNLYSFQNNLNAYHILTKIYILMEKKKGNIFLHYLNAGCIKT